MTEFDPSPYQAGVPTADTETSTADTQPDATVNRRHQVMVVVSMYIGYAMFMVLRMIPTVAGTSITDDPNLNVDTGDWGRILAIGTIGALVGKFIGGYAADKLGGRITFTIGLFVSAVGVLAFAASTAVWMFQATFFLALLAKSSGWPSMAKIIMTSFRPNEYGRVWGVLATSSRIGTLVATLLLGGMLAVISWQTMLSIAGTAGIVITVYFAVSQKSAAGKLSVAMPNIAVGQDEISNEAAHPLYHTSLAEAILHFCQSRQFWLITGSMMGLTIMWDFLLLVPLYLRDTLNMTPSGASVAASAFPFGSLISVLVGGFVFDKLSRRSMAWVMGGMLLIAAGCILTFYLMPQFGMSEEALVGLSLALLFMFGLCVSPCYYIPMSVFSIEFGGPHSGFLIALLDALAFGMTAAFYYFAGEVAEESWTLFLLLLLIVAVWSMLTTFFFLLGETKKMGSEPA
ncbi:MAG: glucose-6-phosphate exchanger SLC37A4 [Fuerstiella sp.]|nr:glucose-6-phosphate exchanger SLC37A4 [Fuerstiella sp.]MCP4511077.1 glucose-6-phosphate exchanger SLC37A4 [Fuerstiella sp.]